MVNKCCIPKCRTGLRGNVSPEGISRHQFPTDEAMLGRWLRAIPRKDWTPSKNTVICSLHFRDSDFASRRADSNTSRGLQRQDLARKIIKADAVPTVFSLLPTYLTKEKPPERSQMTGSSARLEADNIRLQRANDQVLEVGHITTLEELQFKMEGATLPEGIHKIYYQEKLVYAYFSLDKQIGLRTVFSLAVSQDLSFGIHLDGKRLPSSAVSHLVTTGKISDTGTLANMLAFVKAQSEKVPEQRFQIDALVDSLTAAIEEDSTLDERTTGKLLFLIEQLRLATISPYTRRYSPSLLAFALMWENSSPSLYKQMLKENVLSLPSIRHLHNLSTTFSMDTGQTDSTHSYMAARVNLLPERERHVVLLIDEIYTAQRVEYQSGKLYGYESQQTTKTLLCFMVSSVAGHYRDVVCLTPVVNLNSGVLHKMFPQVLRIVHSAGLTVVATSMDNFSANRKFYTELCGGELKTSIPNPLDARQPLFLLFDAVHNFKNIYNNFLGKGAFNCPPFLGAKIGKPSFKHIERIYAMELGKPLKMAHKLKDKVLHPLSIEKTNVKLADAAFHESTINALEFYSKNGHPEFSDTTEFLMIVRKLWNITNVKTPNVGQKKRDDSRQPIREPTDENLLYLLEFAAWVKEWRGQTKLSLTKETTTAVHQTCTALVELARHMLTDRQFQYVLLGQFQSDAIEQRFGWYRQLSGANYYVSVRQVLEAEKSIRVRSLIKLSKMDINEAKSAMAEAAEDQEIVLRAKMVELLSALDGDELTVECKDPGDQNIIFYIAGFIARSITKNSKCQDCKDLYIASDEVPALTFAEAGSGGSTEQEAAMRATFLEQVNRGGLCTPTDLVYLSCLYIWNFYQTLDAHESLLDQVYSSGNPRTMFAGMVTTLMAEGEHSSEILRTHCRQDHSFDTIFHQISKKIFNMMTRNYVSQLNDAVRQGKRPSGGNKSSMQTRKIAKLTSNVV
jgi:hypothetical protein